MLNIAIILPVVHHCALFLPPLMLDLPVLPDWDPLFAPLMLAPL